MTDSCSTETNCLSVFFLSSLFALIVSYFDYNCIGDSLNGIHSVDSLARKMSQVIDLCEGSDDSEELPNTASLPSTPRSRKRLRDKEELSNDIHPRNGNGPVNKTATGSAEFVDDLELANEVEVSVSPHKKRRAVVRKSKPSVKEIAAAICAQVLERVEVTEQDIGSEDSKQTSRDDDGSIKRHSQKLSTSEPSPNASGQPWRVYGSWEDRLSELADYRKIHGNCNVPKRYSNNTKLGNWVTTQRQQYKLHQEGKESAMTLSRIQELERLGFKWRVYYAQAAWKESLSELADYRRIHGHCNVPIHYRENTKLGTWVTNQRTQYRLRLKGKKSFMTLSRIQELEGLGFEWRVSNWEDRLSELADYNRIHGHCNVPYKYSEKTKLGKLGNWVGTQRGQYNLYVNGKASRMNTFRIQELEKLGFEWRVCFSWEDRLSELADYRKIHGHCNVPDNYSENPKLGKWVTNQRYQYRLHLQGKKAFMTLSRIQELEGLGFEWRVTAAWGISLSELADYRKIHGHCNVPFNYSENSKLAQWVATQRKQYSLYVNGKPSHMTTFRIQELKSLGFL